MLVDKEGDWVEQAVTEAKAAELGTAVDSVEG